MKKRSDYRLHDISSLLRLASPDGYDFYIASWCFYFFMMESRDVSYRLVIFDYLVESRKADGAQPLDPVLRRYGKSISKLSREHDDYWLKY